MAALFRSTVRLAAGVERVLVPARALQVSAALNAERRYTKKHEWVSIEGSIGTVGITDFAADQLGDIVYVELPDVGKKIEKGDSTGAVESVKAASDIYAPISGTVTEKNTILEEESGRINKSPFDEGIYSFFDSYYDIFPGWMYKLKVKEAAELKELLSEKEYEEFKQTEEGH